MCNWWIDGNVYYTDTHSAAHNHWTLTSTMCNRSPEGRYDSLYVMNGSGDSMEWKWE